MTILDKFEVFVKENNWNMIAIIDAVASETKNLLTERKTPLNEIIDFTMEVLESMREKTPLEGLSLSTMEIIETVVKRIMEE